MSQPQPNDLGPLYFQDGATRKSAGYPLHLFEHGGHYWAHTDRVFVGKQGGLLPAGMLVPYIRALGVKGELQHEWFAVSTIEKDEATNV